MENDVILKLRPDTINLSETLKRYNANLDIKIISRLGKIGQIVQGVEELPAHLRTR